MGRKAGTQVALPPSWMIQEAAKAAQEAVEELSRVHHSPRTNKSPVSKPTGKGVQACPCGRTCTPESHFCPDCGQGLQKRGVTPESLPNQKRQKKNTKLTTWRCEYKHGVDIRAGPAIAEPRMPHALEPGEEFLVEREEMGTDGILYLKLADGRGWVFDQKPSLGVICAPAREKAALPRRSGAQEPAAPKPKARNRRKATPTPTAQADSRSRSRSGKRASEATPLRRRAASPVKAPEKSPGLVALLSQVQTPRRPTSPASPTVQATAKSPGLVALLSQAQETPVRRSSSRSPRSREAPKASPGLVAILSQAQTPSRRQTPSPRCREAAEKSPGLVAMLSQAQEARGRSAERRSRNQKDTQKQCRGELKAMEAAALGPTSRSPKAEKRTSPMRKIQATRTSPLRKICEAQETPKSSRGDARSSPRSARGVHSEPRSPPVEVHKPSKPSKPSVAAAATHVPRLTKLLATPPKEPRKDLPRRAASQDFGRVSSLIPPHVRAMLAERSPKRRQNDAPDAPPERPPGRRPTARGPGLFLPEVQEISSEESVKDEENLFDDTELRLYRQRQQMERHAQSAWEDAQRLAEHSARVEEAKKLQVVKEKTEAAQKQRHEVEAALQRLRQAVVEVEERAAERTAKLRKQQEVAEEKAREQDALCEKDRGRLESLEEEAAERLKSVEATWAAKLKAQEKPLSCAEEALMQYINKSKSKMESKVKRLEEKATAEQKAVEEEASAQRVVAPQLAALKSEVLATERGAHAADEAWKRAEERACAEEARLGAFLKRLPQLEVEAKQKGEQMAAEAEEKASLDVATAREDARLCREIAGRTVAASRQLVERTRSNGQDRLDRCTLEVTEAEKAALEALEEEKEASVNAQKLIDAARREAPGQARLSARVAAEQRCCAAARKQRQMETKISADLSDLRESNAQKVLAAARVSEAAQLKSTKALRVAERDLETQKEELARKRDQAEAETTEIDRKVRSKAMWFQELREKFIRQAEEAQARLLQGHRSSEVERRQKEEEAQELRRSTASALRAAELHADAAGVEGARREALAREGADWAREQGEMRSRVAAEATQEAERWAEIELQATEQELEEQEKVLMARAQSMRETCEQQEEEATQRVNDARQTVQKSLAEAKLRLAAGRRTVGACSEELRLAALLELQAAEALEESEMTFVQAVNALEAMELHKATTSARCDDAVDRARRGALAAARRAQEAAERRAVEEEERAHSAEEMAEMLQGQAFGAEEAMVKEELKIQEELATEEARHRESLAEALERRSVVDEAIHEAIHYSQKSIEELYRYLRTVSTEAPASQASEAEEYTPTPANPGAACPNCHCSYTPSSSFCQQCGLKLRMPMEREESPSTMRSEGPLRSSCSGPGRDRGRDCSSGRNLKRSAA